MQEMATTHMTNLKVKVKKEETSPGEFGDDQPVSPTGQYFNSSMLNVFILVVFESEVPIDDSPTLSTLQNVFLPINPRFNSIMITDEKGEKKWRRVKVELEEHVNIPTFPSGLDNYDDCVDDYISTLSTTPLPQNRPLWDIHLLKYPARGSKGLLLIRVHHSLGDGYSLMAAIFACLKRADDPSLPLTFPSSSNAVAKKRGVGDAVALCVNTVRDFASGLWKSSVAEDDRSPVRSGAEGVEFLPINLKYVEFSLNDINKIKTKIGGTVNDVICGIIFYGVQLYMKAATSKELDNKKPSCVTALVLLNTRMINSYHYQPLTEMSKPGTTSPWGNHFAFIQTRVPLCEDPTNVDPLLYAKKCRRMIEEKKNSLGVVLTGKMLEIIRKIRGPEVAAKYIYSTLNNTSLAISNMVGPREQIMIADHPVKNFYVTMVGAPQSLTITVVSYMGKLNLNIGAMYDVIDIKLLLSCMEKSFEKIFEAATAMKP